MTSEPGDLLREDLLARARAIVDNLRHEITDGADWFPSLLDAIARWPLPQELVEGRYYRYLIGGEAFDWLLLAERLLETIGDLVPEEERVALLFHGRPPIEQPTEAFRAAIGDSKYRAHLNFVYGVIVEEALQLSAEETLHKELRCSAWSHDRRVDEGVFQRIYGKPREELLEAFRDERALSRVDEISLDELREFTYWLFKFRMRQCDGARVASDTRRGLVQLSHMQARRQSLIPEPEAVPPESCIEGRAVAHA
jgi:hypothetical protein